jgi:hypothetical protein
MRQIPVLSTALLLTFAVAAAAALSSSEAKRLSDATTVVHEFKAVPDKAIPENLWTGRIA